MNSSTFRFNNSSPMATKIEIKKEDPLTAHAASKNEREFFAKLFSIKTNSDAVLLDDDCEMSIKTEIESETPFPGFCAQKEQICFKQIKTEIITSNICGTDMKTKIEDQTLVPEIASQNEKQFLKKDPVMKLKKYNTDHETDNKIEIKAEPWWLERENSSVYNGIEDRHFLPVKSSRLYTEAVSDEARVNAPLSSVEVSGRNTGSYNEKDCSECEHQKIDMAVPTVKKHVLLQQSGKCSQGEFYIKDVYSKQKNLKRSKMPYLCKTCEKSFTQLSHLKSHRLIHEGKKPYKCKTCDKSFTQLSHLRTHNFIHEGKKPHQCTSCDMSFTRLSNLKRHIMIHEGKKPYECTTCGKNFTQLSHLKTHNLIHEGKKPHQCKTCNRSFNDLSNFKKHIMIHEGKKPHECKTCDRGFTRLSNLKRHNLIHQFHKVI